MIDRPGDFNLTIAVPRLVKHGQHFAVKDHLDIRKPAERVARILSGRVDGVAVPELARASF